MAIGLPVAECLATIVTIDPVFTADSVDAAFFTRYLVVEVNENVNVFLALFWTLNCVELTASTLPWNRIRCGCVFLP